MSEQTPDHFEGNIAANIAGGRFAPWQLVSGKCPACGREGLFLVAGSHVTCSAQDCPEPCSAARLLGDEVVLP